MANVDSENLPDQENHHEEPAALRHLRSQMEQACTAILETENHFQVLTENTMASIIKATEMIQKLRTAEFDFVGHLRQSFEEGIKTLSHLQKEEGELSKFLENIEAMNREKAELGNYLGDGKTSYPQQTLTHESAPE